MQDSTIKEQVTRALRSLGETPADIAATLGRGGWLGLRNYAGACPLARYLATVVPNADGATVGAEEATVHFVYLQDIEVDLPRAAIDFVAAFDEGSFPELVVQDTDDNGDVIDDFDR